MSQMFDHAAALGVVAAGHNPWKLIPKKERPKVKKSSTDFLEIAEAAAIIEAAGSVRTRFIPLRTLISTLLLTGGRLSEVLGLQWSDISFDRETVTFQPNEWRPLKSGDLRTIPLWPELRAELVNHRATVGRIGGLVFPGASRAGQQKRIYGKVYKQIERAAVLARVQKHVTPQVFRVTYCAARLQTTDGGSSVASRVVMAEMGHASLDMIERVYGRLGKHRHRSPFVEYVTARLARPGTPAEEGSEEAVV